ncbi:shikimate kinase [Sphingobacterium sp. HJSM2_6]|uniref:shikimate kinase n=1 Tax=Sphingobacterium sp. HJSM2_6 TaxID=3366264 RepID=UPI003BDDDA14
MEKPVFLVGFMGSGKTTWGKKIANALTVPFIDLDHVIEDKIQMTIADYFILNGEENFRKLEQEVLHSLQHANGIISTGGGTACYFDNMDWLLAHGTVLYLKHSPKSLFQRLSQSDVNKRPALKGLQGDDLFAFISAKLDERSPYYEKAHIHVDQINTSLEELIEQVSLQHEL